MLGKLFAYEWKATWKLMVILNGVVVVLSVLGVVFASMGEITEVFSRSDFGSAWVFILYFSFIMVYVLGIIVLMFGTTLYFFIRFYRNLYTDQGYLMHTLPVSQHELILSKALVACIWRIIGTCIMGAGIASIMITVMGKIDDSFYGLWEIPRSFIDEVYDGNAAYFLIYLILTLIMGIGSVVYMIMMGYAAISIGQLATKNKVLASVGVYFGISIVIGIISNSISQFFMLFAIRLDSDDFYRPGSFGAVSIGMTMVTTILVYAAAVGFYIITYKIMQKKLNLE